MNHTKVGLLILAFLGIVLIGCEAALLPTSDDVTIATEVDTSQSLQPTSTSEDSKPLPTLSTRVEEPLHILYAGDAMFDWSVKDAINRYGTDYPYAHIQSEIEQADFSFVNLETAVTLENDKDTNQIYNF